MNSIEQNISITGIRVIKNKETFISPTEKAVIMSFNCQKNKQFKLPNVFAWFKALNNVFTFNANHTVTDLTRLSSTVTQ